jgi:hypothetical protein
LRDICFRHILRIKRETPDFPPIASDHFIVHLASPA